MRAAIVFGATAIAKAINIGLIADHSELFKIALIAAFVADVFVEFRKTDKGRGR